MIRINKSKTIPAPLRPGNSPGAKATAKLCTAADAGTVDHEFSARIYRDKRVKDALKRDQSDKCLFCESKISATQHGDVEHFRPKGGVQQSPDDSVTVPGYYWLVYDWDNLTLCCQICNQLFKKNLFPLMNPESRATSHQHNVEREIPLLIDPMKEDPELFVGFRDEVAYGKDPDHRGKTTIDITGLNRDTLLDRRREHLGLCRTAWQLLLGFEELARAGVLPIPIDLVEQRKLLEAYTSPQREFSAMIRANRPEDGKQ